MDKNSYENSWADQWDPVDHHVPEKNSKNNNNNNTAKYKQKVGEGLVKTKSVASTGFKKVKEGTSVGVQWIKNKYQKTTHKG